MGDDRGASDDSRYWGPVRTAWILGRVSQRVRDGGTGEMIYSHGGARQSCAARSADGRAIEKGQDVVVTAYDRGIATVRCPDCRDLP